MDIKIRLNDDITAKKLCEVERGENTYALYSLCVKESRGYVIYIGCGTTAAAEYFEASSKEADSFFSLICAECLAPEHLCDVVRDVRDEYKRVNFN